MVGSTRFERVTYGLGNHCSIQLSYDPTEVRLYISWRGQSIFVSTSSVVDLLNNSFIQRE